jgi:phosphate uptake regulator
MKQRVNIQYSVQIEELPAELKRMSEKATSSLEETLSSLKQEPEDILSLSSHQHYDEIRVKLASVDAALSDINNIVESYLSYTTDNAGY